MAFLLRTFAFCGILHNVRAAATPHQGTSCENGACAAAGASMLQHASLDNGQSRANVKSIPGASPTCPECDDCTGKKNECPVCPGAGGGYEENVGSYDLSIGDIRADDTTLPFGVAGEVSTSATTGTKSHVTFKIVLSIRNGAKIDELIKLIEDFSGLCNTQYFNGTADVTISATDTALTISASFDAPTGFVEVVMSSLPVHEFLSRGPIKIKGHMGSTLDPNQLLDAPADTYDISADAKFAESLRVEYSDAFWEYLSKYMGSYEQQLVDSFASSSGSDDAAPAPAPVDDSPLEPIYKTASYKALASAYKAEIASAEKPNMVDIQREVQLEFAKLLFGAQYKVQFGSLTNLLRAAAGQRPRLLMLLEAASPRVASWLKSPMSLLTSWNLAQFKQLVWGPILEPPALLPDGECCMNCPSDPQAVFQCNSGNCAYEPYSSFSSTTPGPRMGGWFCAFSSTTPGPRMGITDQILETPLPLVFQTLGGVLLTEATIVQPTWTGQVTLKFAGFDRIVEFLPDEWIR